MMPESLGDGASQAGASQESQESTEGKPTETITEKVQRLRDLDIERADLGFRLYQLTGETKAERESKTPSGQFLSDLGEDEPRKSVTETSLGEEKALIAQGKVGELRFDSPPEESVQKTIAGGLESHLGQINGEIKQLTSDQEVMQAYGQFRERQIGIIRQVREVQKLRAFSDRLDLEEAAIFRKNGQAISAPERQFLARVRALREASEARIVEVSSEPEVAGELRRRQLLEYKRQLDKDHFAETPSRRRYMEKIMNLWLTGKHVMLTGPTGGGKTELFGAVMRKFWGRDLNNTLISGSSTVTDYTLFGKPGGLKGNLEKGMDVEFTPGAFTIGMRDGLPVILDEFDNIDANTRLRLKAVYNLRPGDKFTVQEDTGTEIKIQQGYALGATANIKSEKHKERFALDPAENRVWDERRINYFPKEELYDLSLAQMMDERARIPIDRQSHQSLLRLVDVAEFIQQTYLGLQTDLFSEGGGTRKHYAVLEQAVLDPGKVLGMVKGWRQAWARGENFQNYIEDQLLDFINKEGYPEKDRRLLAQIMVQKYGFFTNARPSDFLVSGLTEQQLDSWRTTRE